MASQSNLEGDNLCVSVEDPKESEYAAGPESVDPQNQVDHSLHHSLVRELLPSDGKEPPVSDSLEPDVAEVKRRRKVQTLNSFYH